MLFCVSLFVAIGGKGTCAQSVTIFGNAVPKNPIDDGLAVTLGVKFWSSAPGTISGIRFYRAAHSPQGYVAKLYSAGGTLLGSATIAQESGPVPGWQQAQFASPVSIAANTTYIAAYYSPVGQGAWDSNALSQGRTNGVLTAPASSAVGGNGVYGYGNSFPSSSYQSSNYYVDVAFSPTAPTRFLSLSFNPPNPTVSSNASLGSVVATILASWTDGSPFTGTLSFGAPYSNSQRVFTIFEGKLLIDPSGPGVSSSANKALNVTIVATQ